MVEHSPKILASKGKLHTSVESCQPSFGLWLDVLCIKLGWTSFERVIHPEVALRR